MAPPGGATLAQIKALVALSPTTKGQVDMMRPTTKHSHIGQHSDIKPGVYFKTRGEWFRAQEAMRPSRLVAYDWEVPALKSDGLLQAVGLPDGDEIELANDGKTPGPFQPARLRVKARTLDDRAIELQRKARRLHQVADSLELEAKAAKGSGTLTDTTRIRLVTIQPQQLRDDVRPYPYHILPNGGVHRQDFWKGNPAGLVGFQDDADVHEINLGVDDFLADPHRAVGKFPVFVTGAGSEYVLGIAIGSVREATSPGPLATPTDTSTPPTHDRED